jgi:McrBC 5-methylcytosine restriction system component
VKTTPTRRRQYSRVPLLPIELREASTFETEDSSTLRIPAAFLIRGSIPRDANAMSARLSDQFIRQNNGILRNFGIHVNQVFNGSSVDLVFQSGTKIGAIPLLSPTSGKPDYGLVIRPRFYWSGIGPMLSLMGWKVIPAPLKLPLLSRSDRKIPAWVLSTIVLFRIKALLDQLDRRFEHTESDLPAPKGTVNWQKYAATRMSSARFLDVPCRFPDLRDDRELKATIHFTLRKQLSSLEGQRSGGMAVLQLIDICQLMLEKVRTFPPKQPVPGAINFWYRGPLKTEVFRDGLQAMEWTIEDRGLAGLSDLQGIPWVMSMDEFFEAWLETLVEKLGRRIGGIVRRGRKRETITPLAWDPPYLGSQKYLLPDLVLERDDETIIFDAKYKGHWEELSSERWRNIEDEIREQHRIDLLQVLAYSTATMTKRIVCCLAYPCYKTTWESLKSRSRTFHRASVYAGNRRVDLVLTAVPMNVSLIDSCVTTLALSVQR